MGSIDPELQILLEEGNDSAGADPAALLSEDGFATAGASEDTPHVSASKDTPPQPEARVLVHFTCPRERLERAGLRITSIAGDVAAGFVARGDLKGLAATEGVVHVEASRPLMDELDLSLEDARVLPLHNAVPPRRGANVIVGIVDSGINVAHGCFCTKDEADGAARTRIRAIWDQTINEPLPSDHVPQPFGYGVEYRTDEINAALEVLNAGGDPGEKFRHKPGAHGTYVAGIAASNGSVPGTVLDPTQSAGLPPDERGYEGVASEADLVVVNYKRDGFMEGSAFVLDAISYIFQVADDAGLPAVVNISQGDSVGAHDGTSLLERGIDNLLGGPGRVIVKSAGNLGLDKSHAAGAVPAAGELELPVEVNDNAGRLCTFDIWYGRGDLFGVAVCPPGGQRTEVIRPGGPCTEVTPPSSLTLPNGNRLIVKSCTGDPYNGDNRIFIQIRSDRPKESIQAGRWSIVLSALDVTDGRFHAWIDTAQLDNGSSIHPRFVEHDSPECTITIPGTSRKIITVAASMTKRAGPDVTVGGFADLSSLGPTRNPDRTGPKPDITAPGQNIVSTLEKPDGQLQYRLLGGTSASAAHVSGAAALLLAEDPRLTQEQVKELLRRHADKEDLTVPPGSNGWGAGRLDVSAAHAGLLAQSQPALPQIEKESHHVEK